MEQKVCKKCKYYKHIDEGLSFHHCKNDLKTTSFCVVTGKRNNIYNICKDSRKETGKCGPDGKFFEPRRFTKEWWNELF